MVEFCCPGEESKERWFPLPLKKSLLASFKGSRCKMMQEFQSFLPMFVFQTKGDLLLKNLGGEHVPPWLCGWCICSKVHISVVLNKLFLWIVTVSFSKSNLSQSLSNMHMSIPPYIFTQRYV